MSGALDDPNNASIAPPSGFGDPRWMMLAGAAQAFGQGAMPVPYRGGIPFGATMGMAAGDAANAARNAYATDTAYQQAQQARMQTQLGQSVLPLALARNQALASFWQNPGVTTGGAASINPSAAAPITATTLSAPPGTAPRSAPLATDNVSQAALSALPDDATRTMATNAALAAGLPMEAWAPWMATVNNESGWNLKAQDGSHGEIGPGQVMPTTGELVGYTPNQLRDPQTNLIASAKYFGQQWQRTQGNPALSMGAYNAGPAGTIDPEYVQRGMGTLAKWSGVPTASGTSLGGITPDQASARADQLEQQANTLEQQQLAAKFWQGQGMPVMPPPGDPSLIRQEALQLRQYQLAGPTAAAQAAAKAPYQRNVVRPGGAIYDANGNLIAAQPLLSHEVVTSGPNAGMPTQVFRNPITGQPVVSGQTAAGSIPGSSPEQGLPPGAVPIGLPPMQHEFLEERGKGYGEQFQQIDEDAEAAKESNYLFDNLRNDSQSWSMGKWADIAGDARAWLSAAGHALGVPDSALAGMDKSLGDFQAFNKSSGMLLRSAVHETSSRAAVQEYRLIGETLPQPTTSQQGFNQIADQWQALSDFKLAKQQFAQNYLDRPQELNVEWNGQTSPTAFLINRMSQTPQGQQDMQVMFQRMATTPEGRLTLSHIQQEYRFAKNAGLFSALPPTGAAPQQQQAAAPQAIPAAAPVPAQ